MLFSSAVHCHAGYLHLQLCELHGLKTLWLCSMGLGGEGRREISLRMKLEDTLLLLNYLVEEFICAVGFLLQLLGSCWASAWCIPFVRREAGVVALNKGTE